MERQGIEAIEALRKQRAEAEVAAEQKLAAELETTRKRNEEELMTLRADSATQLEEHRRRAEQEERKAMEALRTAKQAHEDKLQALVVSTKHRIEVTSAALQQEADEQQALQLQRQKDEHERALADLRNVSAAEIAKAQRAEAAELAKVQVHG